MTNLRRVRGGYWFLPPACRSGVHGARVGSGRVLPIKFGPKPKRAAHQVREAVHMAREQGAEPARGRLALSRRPFDHHGGPGAGQDGVMAFIKAEVRDPALQVEAKTWSYGREKRAAAFRA